MDRRTGVVGTTTRELHEDARIGRNTVPKMLAALEKAGLVKTTRPFSPKLKGETEIVVWSDIVRETARAQALRLLNLKRRQDADKSRISRGQVRE
ncbi:MAG: hypothetical protein WAV54_00445 [Acidimicrobiales bacterium]